MDKCQIVWQHTGEEQSVLLQCGHQGNLKGELGLFFTPVLTLWSSRHIVGLDGGELLYLRIWRNHLVQSAHIFVTA